MADKIKAIAAYTPRIKQWSTAGMDRLVPYIADRCGLNEGTIMNVLFELRDSLVHFNMMGEAVKVEGLGTFSPGITLEGEFKVVYRPDKWIKNQYNREGKFFGELVNKDMIGKTTDDLIARWNDQHPEDPIKIDKKKGKK